MSNISGYLPNVKQAGYHQIPRNVTVKKLSSLLTGSKNTIFEGCFLVWEMHSASSGEPLIIGKFFYVYVDDIIIFSDDEYTHVKHADWVLKTISEDNMKVSVQKYRFFKKSLYFLEFIVTKDGLTTEPEKE